MIDARQATYLQALGIDVYLPRGQSLAPAELDAPVFEPAAEAATARDDEVVARPIVRPGPTPADPPVARPVAKPVAKLVDRPVDPSVVRSVTRPVDQPSGLAAAPPEASPVVDFDWEPLRAAVAACQRCELHATRTQTVFGVGNRQARWMFIGEAPGQEEDRQGEPFVGRAGQLLDAMIRALGMSREDVYIANVLKCRPPGNRDPRPAEAASCRAYLERQVALVDPTLVIAVGRIAAQDLLMTETPIARLRGKVHAFGAKGWPLIVTYHPAYLLRSPGEKRKSWQDLLFARQHFLALTRAAAGRA